MELRHLRYFLAVAELRHFGRAAARLGISQPPLSQQIRDLECELGVRLFERGRGGVRLTDAGAAFEPQARATLAQAARARAEAQRVGRGEAGRLELGFSGSLPFIDVFGRLLREFRATHPAVVLHLRELGSVDQVREILGQRLDLGMLRIAPPLLPQGLQGLPLFSEQLVVALPASHRLARKTDLRLSELAAEPWITFAPAIPGGLPDQVDQLLRAARLAPRVVQQAHEMPTLIGMVAAGIGVTLVAASMRRIHLPGVSFRPLHAGRGPVESTVMLVWGASPSAPANNLIAVARRIAGRRSGIQGLPKRAGSAASQ